MDTKDIKDFLKIITSLGGHSIILVGKGCNPRLLVESILVANGFIIRHAYLNGLTVGDFVGVPYMKNGKTEYLKPLWFQQQEDAPYAFIFHEFKKGTYNDSEFSDIISKLVFDHELDKHGPLKKETIIILPMRREEVCELDPAILDKMFVLDVEIECK